MGNFSGHVISAVAYTPGVAGDTTLDLTGATVTLDEGWSPYVQAHLECAAPDADTLALLDPRAGRRVRLELRQDFGTIDTIADFNRQWAGKTIAEFNAYYGGKTIAQFNAEHSHGWDGVVFRQPVTLKLDLALRSRRVDIIPGSIVFELTSDEALLQDFALVGTASEAPGVPFALTVKAAVVYALQKIGGASVDGLDGPVAADALAWEPGVSAWDYIAPLVQAAGLRLFCDGARMWHLVADVTAEGQLNLSPETGVKTASDTISRDTDWFDSVVVKYAWTDTANVAQAQYDVAGAPGTKTLTVNYDRPFPGAGAAQAILDRAQGRGRVLDVSAISDYTTVPGLSLSITLPDIPVQVGVVSAVTWEFPADTMTVKSRGLIDTPASSWYLVPAGKRWSDVPTGTHWNTYTP